MEGPAVLSQEEREQIVEKIIQEEEFNGKQQENFRRLVDEKLSSENPRVHYVEPENPREFLKLGLDFEEFDFNTLNGLYMEKIEKRQKNFRRLKEVFPHPQQVPEYFFTEFESLNIDADHLVNKYLIDKAPAKNPSLLQDKEGPASV